MLTDAPRPVAVGQQTYFLDQLAAAPNEDGGTHLLYAVIRVTTTAKQHVVHAAAFALVDATGRRYTPVPPSAYVPIDGLDGLTVAPDHAGAGVIAFPIPAAPPVAVLIVDGAAGGALHEP